MGKIIRDPIYGFIKVDKQECQIINHPLFQRLRRIKQLGLTDMVYPSASHNRFEHSLGVMQMASDMFDAISLKNRKELLDLYKINQDDLKRLRKIVRLAALLHDVGHAPFSHASENLMPVKQDSGGIIKHYDHEDYSVTIIKEKFSEIIESSNFKNSYDLKTDDILLLLGIEVEQTTNMTSIASLFFWKELISGSIDADRADYLLRDSYHLGVKYGYYDRHQLVQCLTCAPTKTGALILALEDKGLYIAESFVLARYYMFSQVYFHKVRRIYDYHLLCAIKKMFENLKATECFFPPPEKIDEYCKYDDWLINSHFIKKKAGKHAKIIVKRKHYKCIYEISTPSSDDEKNDIEKLDIFFSKNKEDTYLDDNAITSWYKINKEINIYIPAKKTVLPLQEKSEIIKTISLLHGDKKRYYCDRKLIPKIKGIKGLLK